MQPINFVTVLSHCHYVQEDQKVAWLQDEIHYVSSLEKDCQQKNTVISQLRHQLDTLQQQQHVSGVARLMHPANDTSNTDVRQKLMHFEMELRAKRLEVEELQAKVHLLYVMWCKKCHFV